MAKRRATIHDVARLAGYSTTAVSNALNNKNARISERTREKIRAAARRLHYSPNALIRAIHTGRTNVFGVFMVLPNAGVRRLLSELLIHLQKAAADRGHDLLLHCRANGGHDEQSGGKGAADDARLDVARFLDGRIDGLFYWGARQHEFVDELVERDFPVVGLFSPVARRGAGRVWADETPGLRAAFARLIELGHTDLHVTPYPFESPAVSLRRQALETLRQELPIRIHQAAAFKAPHDRIDWLDSLFRSRRPPTAVIPGGTQDGYYALAVAQRAGLRVPQDVSILCHEGLDAESGFGLSSVRAPIAEVAREGVALLLDMIEGRPRESLEVALPAEFVPGHTIAAPRTARR